MIAGRKRIPVVLSMEASAFTKTRVLGFSGD